MTAKEYLKRLQRLDTIINQKISELADLNEKASSVGAIDYSKDKVQTSNNEAPFVKIIDRMFDLREEINNEIDVFVDEKHKIINEIQQLEDAKHIEILYKHYVEFKRLEVVSVEMNYTYQYVVELHGYALREFQSKFENLLKTNE